MSASRQVGGALGGTIHLNPKKGRAMRKFVRVAIRGLVPLVAILSLVTFHAPYTVHADDGSDLQALTNEHIDLSTLTLDGGAFPAGPTSPTGAGRPPRVGPNVRVNDPQQGFPNGLFGRSETSIAATSDGQQIVAGFNDAQGFCGAPFGVACTPQTPTGLSGYAFSTDGGANWTDGGAPPLFTFAGHAVFTRGDPWIARGGLDGATFYYANLSVDATSGADLGVSVHRGHFDSSGGFAWEDVQVLPPPGAGDFYDKESIAAATDGSGAVYATVTNFKQVCGVPGNGFGQIEVWRSHDGGATWQGPAIAGPDLTAITDPANPACGQTGVLQQSSNAAIGPHGELYVTWSQGPTFTSSGVTTDARIVVATSLDGGATFSAPVVVANTNSMRQDPPVGYNRNRLNDHPRIAVATSGPHAGRVYDVYYSANAPATPVGIVACPTGTPANSVCIDQNLISSQVYVTFSDDHGATWSAPTALAPAEPATGVKRFWPVVSIESGGTVDVVYLESQETPTAANPICRERVGTLASGKTLRRVGSANSLVNTFWVQSTDGAHFGAPLQMSSATSNWCTTASNVTPNFGDYIGSTSGGNRVLAVWADGRNGVPDTFYATGLGAGKSS
ncbi:MAG TPA: sialidase family protein [Ktedonobacterales bacterium]